jgi:hypothetical protein
MDKMHLDMATAEKAFALRLEQTIERAIQEVLNTADEATDNVNLPAEHLIQQLKETKETVPSHPIPVSNIGIPTRPSRLFPNVDKSDYQKPSPFRQPFKYSDMKQNDATLDSVHQDYRKST